MPAAQRYPRGGRIHASPRVESNRRYVVASRPPKFPVQAAPLKIAHHIRAMPPVGSRLLATQVRAARRRGVDVLPLMPYAERAPSPEATEAVVREIRDNREAPSRGLPELREAVADRIGDEIGQPVDPESEVLVTSGSMQALNLVFRATINPGDEVIIPSPCYFFGGCVELAGGRPVHVPMAESEGYAWDVDRIAAAITSRTTAIVVNTPVNPTGVVLDEDTLRAVADLAERHDLLIVSDESYDTMIYDGRRHVSCAGVSNAAARTAIVRSFTKSFAMPAWRVGYIVGPPSVIDACTKALEWEQLHGNHVAQAGAAAAMRHPVYPGDSMAREFQQLRDVIYPFVAPEHPLYALRPAGGPFVFINVSEVFESSTQASAALLEAGIPTTAGHFCRSDRHVRMAFGAPPEVLREAGRRLREIAADHTAIQSLQSEQAANRGAVLSTT